MADPGNLRPFQRLDLTMVTLGLAPSRARASDMVARGVVFVDGTVAQKAAQKVSPDTKITLDDPAQGYVSRSALKLKAALEAFDFSPHALTALDIGASTGGFSQVLLEEGAKHIYAVDVGHDQLHGSLRSDDRVTNLEGVNARYLQSDQIGEAVNIVVSDVSFISLKLALPPALSMVQSEGWAALLVKPQFEVGRRAIGKGGLVTDLKLAKATADDIAMWLDDQPGWAVKGLIDCPIKGADGNQEYMLGAQFYGS